MFGADDQKEALNGAHGHVPSMGVSPALAYHGKQDLPRFYRKIARPL